MFLSKAGKRLCSAIILVSLYIVTSLSAYAANETVSPSVDIRLKLGSTQMTVNGSVSTVVAPFQKNGATYIPLSALTKGLGAKLQLQSNKALSLSYAGHKVILTPDSKTAVADGKKITLQAAPVTLSASTMIPLKVAELFSAKTVFTPATKEIRITAAAASVPSDPGAGSIGGIDSDAGKTRIGDSYYQWSINYPTGLVQSNQSTDGDSLEFRDIKKEYYLGIFVRPAADPLTAIEVRNKIYSLYYDTENTVDKQTVTRGELTYESVITKDKEGLFYEYRGIQANGNLYIIAFGKKVANAAGLSSATSVLDTFKTSFDRTDMRLKDLTQIIEGYKSFSFNDYGLTLKLPKEWSIDEKSNTPYYEPKDQSAYVYVNITSLVPGDTNAAWVERKVGRFKDAFALQYGKVLEQTAVTWNGMPAIMQKLSYSYDTKNWWEEYEIFAVQGKYRYYGEVAYLQNRKTDYESVLDTVLKSAHFDYAKVEKNFGQIVDDTDIIDRLAVTTKTSRKYGYSIKVPQRWTGVRSDMDKDDIYYSFQGGALEVTVIEGVQSTQEVFSQFDAGVNSDIADHRNLRLIENTMTTIGGLSAKKAVIDDDGTGERSPNRVTEYCVVSNNRAYIISGLYYLAFASDINLKQLTDSLNSFTLNSAN